VGDARADAAQHHFRCFSRVVHSGTAADDDDRSAAIKLRPHTAFLHHGQLDGRFMIKINQVDLVIFIHSTTIAPCIDLKSCIALSFRLGMLTPL